MPPLLSHIITGRNDNYLGNFNQRLELVVNHTCTQISAAGFLDDYELLIVDWNSPRPLRQELNLNEAARARTWFLEVPPGLVREQGLDLRPTDQPAFSLPEAFKGYQGAPLADSSLSQTVDFNPAIAANIGYRRARGEFVIYTPADVFFPRRSIENLFSLLKGCFNWPGELSHCYLGIDRFLVPWQRAERLSLADMDRYLALHGPGMSMGQRFTGHAGDEGAYVFSRDLIRRLRGSNERYVDWGFHDAELARRIAQTGPNLKAAMAGVFCYDFQQKPRLRTETITRANLDRVELNPEVNDESWGLGALEIPFQQALHLPDIQNRSSGVQAYDPASLMEKKPICPSKAATAWRRLLRRNLGPDNLGRLAARLFNRAGKLKKRALFSRLGYETLMWELEKESAFGPWFGDQLVLFSYFRNALDKGLHRLISRWSLEQARTLLAVLATIGRRRPTRFFYAGMRDFYVAQAAAAVDPTLEISAYDHWSTELYPAGHGSDRLYYYGHISTALKEVDFQGYLHIETGPLETALERLASTPLAGEPFEAMFLNLDFLAPILDRLAPATGPLMAEDCALIIRGRPDQLEQSTEAFRSQGFSEGGRLPGLLILHREANQCS